MRRILPGQTSEVLDPNIAAQFDAGGNKLLNEMFDRIGRTDNADIRSRLIVFVAANTFLADYLPELPTSADDARKQILVRRLGGNVSQAVTLVPHSDTAARGRELVWRASSYITDERTESGRSLRQVTYDTAGEEAAWRRVDIDRRGEVERAKVYIERGFQDADGFHLRGDQSARLIERLNPQDVEEGSEPVYAEVNYGLYYENRGGVLLNIKSRIPTGNLDHARGLLDPTVDRINRDQFPTYTLSDELSRLHLPYIPMGQNPTGKENPKIIEEDIGTMHLLTQNMGALAIPTQINTFELRRELQF